MQIGFYMTCFCMGSWEPAMALWGRVAPLAFVSVIVMLNIFSKQINALRTSRFWLALQKLVLKNDRRLGGRFGVWRVNTTRRGLWGNICHSPLW